MIRKALSLMLLLLSLSLVSCGSKSSKNVTIAIDPSFFPLNIQGREENVYVFIHDLLQAIGEEEGISFSKVNVSWDMLLSRLNEEKYDAAISPIMPYVYNQNKYEFSDVVLRTGPVLVVRNRSNISALSDMPQGFLFVQNLDEQQMIMESYPEMITQVYDSPPPAFERVLDGYADGLLLESIEAVAYVSDIYANRLRIAEGPYGKGGLRVITRKGDNEHLIRSINKGLAKLQANGTYDALAKKWRLQ